MSAGSTSSDDKTYRNSSSDDTPPSTSLQNSLNQKIRVTTNYPLIPKTQLEVQEQLGVGTYGSVHKGIWKTNNGLKLVVALKKVFMLEKEVYYLKLIIKFK